jgi:hypothetical protein
MDVIVLDGDSDEDDQQVTIEESSSNAGPPSRPRPSKRRKTETSTTHVSDTAESVSHISDTILEPSVTEAPVAPAALQSGEADSPTLSPQQARILTVRNRQASCFFRHFWRVCR